MGNSNRQMSLHERGKEMELCMSNGHTVPDVQSSAETSDQPDFTLHGIDYLPESEKRKERRRRRKSTVPRFLRIDTTLWSSSYLRFLNRISRSALTTGVERRDSETYQANSVTAANGRYAERPENRTEAVPIQPVAVETPDCFREIVSDEWTKYNSYPFENLVFSGGGSKGYAYIGTLQVCHLMFVFYMGSQKALFLHFSCTQWDFYFSIKYYSTYSFNPNNQSDTCPILGGIITLNSSLNLHTLVTNVQAQTFSVSLNHTTTICNNMQ